MEVEKDFDTNKLSTVMLASLDRGMQQARKEKHDTTNFIK